MATAAGSAMSANGAPIPSDRAAVSLSTKVRLIDLARWFLGDFTVVEGFADTFFWDMPVDDNGFMLLRTSAGKTAFLHASCTEWKNMFSFEIYGKVGKIHINGLGGSFGVERLAFHRTLPEMGPPETTNWDYPMADNSWTVEFEEFIEDIRQARTPSVGLTDALAVLGRIGVWNGPVVQTEVDARATG
jgi:predicted dehydrogenase